MAAEPGAPTTVAPTKFVAGAVSADTLARASRALAEAKVFLDEFGGDQFTATFAQEDGTLGGKVTLIRGQLVVQFDLLGSKRSG